MRKKIISLLLALVLCVSIAAPVFAASETAIAIADTLYMYGLFKGVGNNADGSPNYDLDRGLTRAEAVTLLVRLLGKDAAATAGTHSTPFNDVPEWAKPYVGYAYANGLTNGVSDTSFGSGDSVSATQYLTFMLRALGYESGVDFQWDAAWILSDELKITSGQYGKDTEFLRSDAVIVSYYSIFVEKKGTGRYLHNIIFDSLASEANPAHPERVNDYENGKNDVYFRPPAEWTLSDTVVSKYIYNKQEYYLYKTFNSSVDAFYAVCNNRKTKSSVVIASGALSESYVDIYSLDILYNLFNSVVTDGIFENHTTICGREYAGLLYEYPDRDYNRYLFATVFDGELIVINVFCRKTDSIDTIMSYFE